MKHRSIAIVVMGIALLAGPPGAPAQDWTDASLTLWNEFGSAGTNDGQFIAADGIAVDENGYIYVSDSQLHRIQVFRADGTFVRKWGSQGAGASQFNSPRGLAVGPDGNLYVCDWLNQRVSVFDTDGTFVTNWGSAGTGDGQFNHPRRVCVNKQQHVFVSDYDNKRIQVFTTSGGFLRRFDSVDGSSNAVTPEAITADSSDRCYVGDSLGTCANLRRYSSLGAYEIAWQVSCYNSRLWSGLATDPAGRIFTATYNAPGGMGLNYWTQNGSILGGAAMDREGLVVLGPDGSVFRIVSGTSVRIYRWHRRTAGTIADGLCLWTKIEDAAQRPSVPLLDLQYRVNSDIGITNVEVAPCAFLDGQISLAKMIPMRTFVEGTSTNAGPNVRTGDDIKTLTWNMAADWSGDSGNLSFQVFAHEGPYYLDFHWLAIPAGGAVTQEFQICRTPVTDDDVKPVWMFLIARGDPDLVMTGGVVYGTTGAHSGRTLASDSGTTSNGYEFLWERMDLREPTADELQYAREATIPGVQQWEPRFRVGSRPYKVNEFGLDTGAAAGRWAVKE